jgi:hypothetical protein
MIPIRRGIGGGHVLVGYPEIKYIKTWAAEDSFCFFFAGFELFFVGFLVKKRHIPP